MTRMLARFLLALFALGVLTPGARKAFADKLSDFQDAVKNNGCDSIPYSDYRSTCQSQQSSVHEWCDGGRGPVTCVRESITRELKDAVEKAKRDVETAKDTKDKADRKRSQSGLSDSDKRAAEDEYKKASDNLDAATKQLEQANRDLEGRGKLVNEAIYNLEKCIDYRRAVMNAFASAIDRVRNENDPPAIVPLARQLRDKWESGKPGHEEQITARKNALDTCKGSRP
jgi:hypothetical protein